MSQRDLLEIEKSWHEKGYRLVCGVDEAGRGPLAGPVFAAAVILPVDVEISGLDDSKKLSDKKRRELFPLIKEAAIAHGIAMVDHRTIDEINILQATYLAMQKAVAELTVLPEIVFIDGNRAPAMDIPVQTIVHGDSLSASIAAASVLAKVSRDDYMLKQAELYPEYGFEVHKGYGTKAHYDALSRLGPCPIHRMTFLKKFYGEK